MPQVISPAFLQALGYTLVNSLWQFAALWLLYSIFLYITRLSARLKYLAGMLLQTAGFIWFIATFFSHYTVISNQSTTTAGFTDTDAYGLSGWLAKSEELLPYFSLLYLVVFGILMLRSLYAYRQTCAIRTIGTSKIPVDWRIFVQQVSYQLGIKKNVRIYLSNLVQTPLTIGHLKPVILIPLASLNNLTKEQMEAVILHELAHIIRCDYLFNLLLILIETVLYFNPFMHLMSSCLKKERENCCDDVVLQFRYNSFSYASALLNIAVSQTKTPPLFALNASNGKYLLLNRVKRITGHAEVNTIGLQNKLLAVLFLFLTVLPSIIPIPKITTATLVSTRQAIKTEIPAPTFYSSTRNTELTDGDIKPVRANQLVTKGEHLKTTPSTLLTNNSPIDNADVFYNTSDNITANSAVHIIPAVADMLPVEPVVSAEKQLMKDVAAAVEKSKNNSKTFDAITFKTMMLARVRQMINEEQQQINSVVNDNNQQLQLLERKLAGEVLNKVIISKSSSICISNDTLMIKYDLPNNGSENNYVFEYVIAPSATVWKEAPGTSLVDKQKTAFKDSISVKSIKRVRPIVRI